MKLHYTSEPSLSLSTKAKARLLADHLLSNPNKILIILDRFKIPQDILNLSKVDFESAVIKSSELILEYINEMIEESFNMYEIIQNDKNLNDNIHLYQPLKINAIKSKDGDYHLLFFNIGDGASFSPLITYLQLEDTCIAKREALPMLILEKEIELIS